VGWEVENRPFGEMTYTIWKAGGEQVAGGMQMDENFPPDLPSHWLIYFAAQSSDDSAAKVSELGGTVAVPPSDIPDMGRFAVVTDPQGAAFAFFTPTG
jgi:predicted enzyme related to lactoylglutathione lyase